jgi:hypothetical protein
MALYGVDISSYQTRVDYTLWSFYMIKASEGRTLKDKMLDIHYNGVHGEDRLFGFYHYAHPENNDIVDEAKFFLDLVGRHAGHAVYALDWEGKALNYGPKTALRWLDYVYSVTKVRPLFYCSDSRTARYAEIAKHDYGLWVAKYSSRGPAHIGWPFCAMWQYSAKDMDYDVFFGTPLHVEAVRRPGRHDRLDPARAQRCPPGQMGRDDPEGAQHPVPCGPRRRRHSGAQNPGLVPDAHPGAAGAASLAWCSCASGSPPTASSGTRP